MVPAKPQPDISVISLAGTIYSAGKVFDALSAGRLATENFLRSGNTIGINSRTDLALLEDLKDMANFVIQTIGTKISASYICAINENLSRSAALHPGRLRTAEQKIGVATRYGRHEPRALTHDDLQELVKSAQTSADISENAVTLFTELAKAQPFADGNKRTALFAANALLLSQKNSTHAILSVPHSETDPAVADNFNDLLARAYIYGETNPVKLLLSQWIMPLTPEK